MPLPQYYLFCVMVRNYSNIKYVYFIKSNDTLIYIGRSAKPLYRIKQHYKITKKLSEFTLEVYGPYDEYQANSIEAAEIHRVLKSKNNKQFLANTTTIYVHNKKLSVKDSGAKTVYQFEKKGKTKKMVSQYAY